MINEYYDPVFKLIADLGCYCESDEPCVGKCLPAQAEAYHRKIRDELAGAVAELDKANAEIDRLRELLKEHHDLLADNKECDAKLRQSQRDLLDIDEALGAAFGPPPGDSGELIVELAQRAARKHIETLGALEAARADLAILTDDQSAEIARLKRDKEHLESLVADRDVALRACRGASTKANAEAATWRKAFIALVRNMGGKA